MVSNSGFALLIGIDHYSKLGEGAELLGSRNDVLMWHWFCRQHLGIPPENIRMLTSPALDPNKDFGGDTVPAGTLAEATEKAIREGYAWLLSNMKGGQTPGLLSYSGHGLLVGGKVPALSTSDMLSDGTGAIALRDIGKAVQDAHAQEALTAVFDCCHVAAPSAKSDLRTTTSLPVGADDAASIDDEDFNVSHRVFLAARPGQEAHQGKLGRNVHGALSFALVTAAEQWKASQAPGQTGLDVNHKQLFKRARKLVRALRMKQSLKLRVPFDRQSRSVVRKMPFFGLHAGFTTRKADAPRHKIQVDPGQKDFRFYTITQGDTVIAYIVSMNTTQTATFGGTAFTFTGGQEYWYPQRSPALGMASNDAGAPLTFSCTGDLSWSSWPPSSEVSSAPPQFQASSAPGSTGWTQSWGTPANFFYRDPGNKENYLTLAWDLSVSGSTWTGYINWYTNASSSNADAFCGEVFQWEAGATPFIVTFTNSFDDGTPTPDAPPGTQTSTWTAFARQMQSCQG